MQTSTSAKRVILLLISLNVVTILTSVAIISSGMFVAKANSLNPPCNPNANSNNAPPSLQKFQLGTFKGKIVTTKNKRQAILNLTLTGNNPPHISGGTFSATAPGNATAPLTFTNGTIENHGSLANQFFGDGTDGKGSQFRIQFYAIHITSDNRMEGTYDIIGGAYDRDQGSWSVTRQ